MGINPIIIIISIWSGTIIFFSAVVAPTVFKSLDEREAGVFLRAFFPKYTILEDPVTGSAHTKLIPYWFERTGKKEFISKQISKRGGELFCEYDRERVSISGYAKMYLKGEIHID